jgi:hypothetical protein
LGSALSGKQSKAERVTLSHRLFEVLEKDEKNHFHNILTGDKSWFYLKYLHEPTLAAFRNEIPEKIKQKLTLKMPDLNHLVREQDPQFIQCTKRHYI